MRVHRYLSIMVALAGCSPTGLSDERAEFRESRDRWRAQQLSSYEYVLRQSCFCPSEITAPIRVQVRQGEVVSVLDAETSAPRVVDPARPLTVEDLFVQIEDAFDRGAEEVVVTYDAQRGYPASISIDYDERVIDEEVAFSATDLRILD